MMKQKSLRSLRPRLVKIGSVMLMAIGTLMAFSCSGDEVVEYAEIPEISVFISQETSLNEGGGTVTVKVRPSANVTSFEYGLAKNNESLDDFESGQLTGKVTVEGNDEQDVILTDIEANAKVMVYARGFMKSGERTRTGATSVLTLNTNKPVSSTSTIEYELGFVSESIASFKLIAGQSTYRVSYSISSPGKLRAFTDDNQLEFEEDEADKIQYIYEKNNIHVTRMDLKPETKYSLYYKGYNRFDELIHAEEVPFTTTSLTGDIPDVRVETLYEDAYSQSYRIVSNENAGKSIVYGLPQGYFDEFYGNWEGDLIGFMENAAAIPVFPNNPTINLEGEGNYEVKQFSAEMLAVRYEMSILIYNKEGNPARFRQVEYGYETDPNLPLPGIELSAVPVKHGARVTVQPDTNTMGYYMVTIVAEPGYDPERWSDQECKNVLFNSGVYGYDFQYIQPEDRGKQIQFNDVTQGAVFEGDKVTILMMGVNNNGGSFSNEIGCGPVLRHTYTGVGDPRPSF